MLSEIKKSKSISFSKTEESITSCPQEISNRIGLQWSKYSADQNFHEDFVNEKHRYQIMTYEPKNISLAAKKIDSLISSTELESVLQGCKGETAGFDSINYPM